MAFAAEKWAVKGAVSMVRTYYRLSLSALCAIAALVGPILFLADRPKLGYLLGGLSAALLTWLLLRIVIATEAQLTPPLQGILGAGAAVFSWMTISLVAIFDVIPHALQFGLALFDPVWILGGISPVVILGVAYWRAARGGTQVWAALYSALYRFSAPLVGLQLAAVVLNLAKQYRWLFLFTGVMFLVLDVLGTEEDQAKADTAGH